MLCCGNCFGDAFLASEVESQSTETGCCGYCGSQPVRLANPAKLSDLFEKRITHAATPAERRELRQAAKLAQWKAALPLMHRECLVVIVAAGKILSGEMLAQADNNRLAKAIDRIESAKAVLCGR